MPRDAARDNDRHKRRNGDRDPERRHRKHRPTESGSNLLPRHDRDETPTEEYHVTETASSNPSPQKSRHSRTNSSSRGAGGSSNTINPLSAGSLAQLDRLNDKRGWSGQQYDQAFLEDVQRRERKLERERRRDEKRERRAERAERNAKHDEVSKEEVVAAEAARKVERMKALEREKWEKSKRAREAQRDREERYEEYEYESAPEDKVRVYRDEKRHRRWHSESARDEHSTRYKHDRGKSRGHGRETRQVSGTVLEKGGMGSYRGKHRGGNGTSESPDPEEPWWRRRRKRLLICIALFLVIVIIAISVGVVVARRGPAKDKDVESVAAANTPKPSNANLNGVSENDYPKGTYYDPFGWYDTQDFNISLTKELVGGLPIMGLNSTWNDNVQCNPKVPPLNEAFAYGSMPIRGINIGGWLAIEPLITPSFFKAYSSRDNVIDEWSLCTALGSSRAATALEQHYSAFVNRQTFVDIRNAGFDHVRIPFSYWAVRTYDSDPYVAQISWRYLLRAIEWARQNGLRINLDLHGLPGSQNGWNHSGRQGNIGWLNGTDGALNAQRSLDIHDQLSTFFSQDRYKNIVTMYGLANEPRMVDINTDSVVEWTTSAISLVRRNGIAGIIVFGDGFMGLDNWQGRLTNQDKLVLDVHQYVVFNNGQLVLNHHDKLNFACKGWTVQMRRSQDTSTGFGPTMCGEWSQAETDCATFLNNVGIGTRWEGTMDTGNATTSTLTPTCPTNDSPKCTCNDANADPGSYSAAYKQWLLNFAEAQMDSFEEGWGWFYWTWDTEESTQWSYKKGLAAGILPSKTYERSWTCRDSIADFVGMGLAENF